MNVHLLEVLANHCDELVLGEFCAFDVALDGDVLERRLCRLRVHEGAAQVLHRGAHADLFDDAVALVFNPHLLCAAAVLLDGLDRVRIFVVRVRDELTQCVIMLERLAEVADEFDV